MFHRARPAPPADPTAVRVFTAFAAALRAHDWEAVAPLVAEEVEVRWRGCGRRQHFETREAYLAAWQSVLSRDDLIDFHHIFGDEQSVAAEFTRRRLNGLSLLSGTVICIVRDGRIVREWTHEVPL